MGEKLLDMQVMFSSEIKTELQSHLCVRICHFALLRCLPTARAWHCCANYINLELSPQISLLLVVMS